MKIEKGTYLFSEDEIKQLLTNIEEGKNVFYNGRKYIPLYINNKSKDVREDDFLEKALDYHEKKNLAVALGTSIFKLNRFMLKKYATDNLYEVHNIIRNKK